MLLRWRRRQPDYAYKGQRDLWLPKSMLEADVIKRNLELESTREEDKGSKVILWKEMDNHLLVPREYLNDSQEAELTDSGYLLHDPPCLYESVNFYDGIQPRDLIQEEAWEAFKNADRGILVLACGRGKTALGCKRIALEGTPAIVIARAGHVLDQWATAATNMLGLRDRDIGWIRGAKADWQGKSLVLATLQTIARRADTWPSEFTNHFGIIIFDEVHCLAAPFFCRAAPLFSGKRFGLTATPEREDGLEAWYYYHLGPPFFANREQPVKPKIVFLQLPTFLNFKDPEVIRQVTDRFGNHNFSHFRSWLASSEERNATIVMLVRKLLVEGRKVMVLSHLKEHLRLLSSMLPEGAILTGDVPVEYRIKTFLANKLILATNQLAEEALDDPGLNTVIFVTPFGARRSLVQGMGRALREMEGKEALVVILDDHLIPFAKGPMRRLRARLKELNCDFELQKLGGERATECTQKRTKRDPLQALMKRYERDGRIAPSASCRRKGST